jgi:hypothetical protein
MKQHWIGASVRPQEEYIAGLGGAEIIKHLAGHLEISDGTDAEKAQAHAWMKQLLLPYSERWLGWSNRTRVSSTPRWCVDSCKVGPALLAEGVGGNRSKEPSSGVAAMAATARPHKTAKRVRSFYMEAFWLWTTGAFWLAD